MKLKYMRHIIAAVLASLFSISAVGSLITGWNISVTSVLRIYAMCCAFSLFTSIGWYFRRGNLINLSLTVLVMLRLMYKKALWNQLASLLWIITKHFNEVYGWRTFGNPSASGSELALFLVGYLAALSVTYCICRIKPFAVALPFVLLPLILCLPTTDTLPSRVYLYILITGVVVMLLTEWTRTRAPKDYPLIFIKTAVPTALMLGLAFTLSPDTGYRERVETLLESMTSFAAKTRDTVTEVRDAAAEVIESGFTGSTSAQKLNLKNVGPKKDGSAEVMDITSPDSGYVYLRGRDYDIYTGKSWESSEDRSETLPPGAESTGVFTVSTYRVRDILYTPYYPMDSITLSGGCVKNSENLKSYGFSVSDKSKICSYPSSVYIALPEATAEWADGFVNRIVTSSDKSSEKAKKICAYVKKHASYDLSTPTMSSSYDDFAEWFLSESDTGYCVHFATAAAVLLRAAGIPARYVEGYASMCVGGQTTMITSAQAHAWVEYFDSELSTWRILEATPADGITSGEIRVILENTETEKSLESTETEKKAEATESDETKASETHPAKDAREMSSETSDNGDTKKSDNPQNGIGASDIGDDDTSNTDTADDEAQATREPFKLPHWVKKAVLILLGTAAFVFLIPLQAYVRSAAAQKRRNTGKPNEKAIVRWKELRRIAETTKTPFPKELDSLAMKAKFSQHTLTPDELSRFESFRERIVKKVNDMPIVKKYLFRWLYAIM